MANETITTVVGNLTADPELRFTPSARSSPTSPSPPRRECSTGSPGSGATGTPCSCDAPSGATPPSTSPSP